MTTTMLRLTAREVADEIRRQKERYHRSEVLPVLIERLREELVQNPALLEEILARAARESLTDVERQDAPKRDILQGYLFQPDRYWTLGDDERVLMANAKLNDAVRRSSLLDENFERQSEAHFEEKRYLNERLEKWADDPSAQLLELEREYFDYGSVQATL